MKKEIVYKTVASVSNVRLEEDKREWNVMVSGYVIRNSGRKLLWLIPLPDKYSRKVSVTRFDGKITVTDERSLLRYTFDSRKRVMTKRNEIENTLKEKCKEYRRQYGKRGDR